MKVLADRGKETAMHALGLQTEHHDDIAIMESLIHVIKNFGAHLLNFRRNKSLRRD